MKRSKWSLILILVAVAAVVLSACQEKPYTDSSNTPFQASEQSTVLNGSNNDTATVSFDPDAQTKLPEFDRNDFEYVINNSSTQRFEFGNYYGFTAASCVNRYLSVNNTSTKYGEYSLSSGLRPGESTLEDFCSLYNINFSNAIISYTSNNLMTYHYSFDKNSIGSYDTSNANSYVIVETCWSYQNGKWERMSATDEAALAQGKSTLTSDAIFSVAIELDNETKTKAQYVYVSYGTPADFNTFNNSY